MENRIIKINAANNTRNFLGNFLEAYNFQKLSAEWHLPVVQPSVKNFINSLEMIIARPTH